MRKILIVDDELNICQALALLLQDYGYNTEIETDSRGVLPLLHNQAFDAILIDLMMPKIDGIALIQQIKKPFPNLPVLIITGHGSIERAVKSMQAGAADFVTKPVDGPLLTIRLQKAIEHAQHRRLAYTDGLTSLDNYRSFHTQLQQEIDRATRYSRPLSLIMIDIDYFKTYNDTHGHPQGDETLAKIATVLKQLSRASDIVARYGGEEFAIILPETDKPRAEAFGNRLREEIELHKFPGEERLPGSVLTISVGIASHPPMSTKDELISAADRELYRAKRGGRNRVCARA